MHLWHTYLRRCSPLVLRFVIPSDAPFRNRNQYEDQSSFGICYITSLTLTSMLCREGSMPYLASLTLACMLLRERNQLLQVVSMGGFNIESGSGKMCC